MKHKDMTWTIDQLEKSASYFEAGSIDVSVVKLGRQFGTRDEERLGRFCFKKTGFAKEVDIDGEGNYREVENRGGAPVYFDRDWVSLREEDLVQYRFDISEFVDQLIKVLHLGGRKKECIRDTLWFLGYYKKESREVAIWLCRRLSGSSFDCTYDYFAREPEGVRKGIVISQTQPPYQSLTLPGDYKIIKPAELLNDSGYLSLETLEHGVSASFEGNRRRPVEWDKNSRTLHRKGKSPIQFKGSMQSKVIELLYERCLRKNNKYDMNELLEDVESGSSHINKIFNKKERWREVVAYGDGMCWLIIPEQ